MDGIERNIIENSEYIIEYYKQNQKTVTNLELQKLAYFLEAIYMVCTDEQYLYKEQFSAWNFGPVNTEIYNRYKSFGSMPIELDHEVNINRVNLKYIKILYNLFNDFTAAQLVNLSHIENSPWYNISKKWNSQIPKNVMISKNETKEWFSTLVVKKDEQ